MWPSVNIKEMKIIFWQCSLHYVEWLKLLFSFYRLGRIWIFPTETCDHVWGHHYVFNSLCWFSKKRKIWKKATYTSTHKVVFFWSVVIITAALLTNEAVSRWPLFVWLFLFLRILYIKAADGNSWTYLFRNTHADRTSKRVGVERDWPAQTKGQCLTSHETRWFTRSDTDVHRNRNIGVENKLKCF